MGDEYQWIIDSNPAWLAATELAGICRERDSTIQLLRRTLAEVLESMDKLDGVLKHTTPESHTA